MNLNAELRRVIDEYIAQTPNLPDHIKPMVRNLLIKQVNMVAEYIGVLELLWRRKEK